MDECLFYKGDIIFIVYVDDGIFLGNDDAQLPDIIKQLKNAGLDVEDQGHPADYVGVNINHTRDGTVEFSQRTLIDNIISDSNDTVMYSKLSLLSHLLSSMHTRKLLILMAILATDPWLASSITLPRQHALISYMQFIKLPSSPLVPSKSMVKPFSTLCGISSEHVMWD